MRLALLASLAMWAVAISMVAHVLQTSFAHAALILPQ